MGYFTLKLRPLWKIETLPQGTHMYTWQHPTRATYILPSSFLKLPLIPPSLFHSPNLLSFWRPCEFRTPVLSVHTCKHCFYSLRIDFIKLFLVSMSLLHTNHCFLQNSHMKLHMDVTGRMLLKALSIVIHCVLFPSAL